MANIEEDAYKRGREDEKKRVVEIIEEMRRVGAELLATPLGFEAWKRDNYFYNQALSDLKQSIIK